MSSLIPSLIRTYVPMLVALLGSWLASLGIDINDDQKAALVGVIGTVVGGLYYLAVRVLEKKVPSLTWLLGSPVQPVAYKPGPLAPAVAAALPTPPVTAVAVADPPVPPAA